MNTHRIRYRALPAMLLLLLAVAGPAFADGSLTLGSQWWDQTVREAKYQEFSDIPNGPYIRTLMLRDPLWGGRYSVVANHALRNDQATAITYRKPRWTTWLNYSRIPHNFSYYARTPYVQVNPGVYTLPDSLQKLNQTNSGAYTSTMGDALKNADPIPLAFRTDVSKARVKGRLAHGVEIDIRGTRRQRNGDKAYAETFGFSNAVEITEPIHQVMNIGEAHVSYAHKRLSLEGIGGIETFHNKVDALRVDNPKIFTDTATGGSSTGQLDLYPDNKTVRGTLMAGLQLPRTTTANLTVGLSETTQNDRWLPYTVNTAILQPDTVGLPGTNTQGKVRAWTQDYRVTTHPSNYWNGTLRFQRYEFLNKTVQHTFPGSVAYDQTWSYGDEESEAFGNATTTFGADVDVIPDPRMTVCGTYEHVRLDRTHREVAKNTEDVVRGKVVARPVAGLNLEASYRHGDRKLDSFDLDAYDNAEQPTLRRYDVAPRQQNQVKAGVGWVPNDRADISVSVEYLRNEYKDGSIQDSVGFAQNQLGLLDDQRRSASAEGTFQLTNRLDFSASYGIGQIYTNQRSRQSGSSALAPPDSTWQARLKDWFYYSSTTLEYRPKGDRVTLTAHYEFDRAPGTFRLTKYAGTKGIDLPSTVYRREGVGVDGWYKVDDKMRIGARWAWEQFKVHDFSTTDVPLLFPTTGTANTILLGDSMQDYKAHQLALFVERSF
ncbi:MAG TPA: MtrB/PioB family outer membrane beta-barrel protein [Candidatus Eisenbacteria bacterium]